MTHAIYHPRLIPILHDCVTMRSIIASRSHQLSRGARHLELQSTTSLLPRRWSSTSSSSSHNPYYDLFPQTLAQGPPPSGPFPINLRALRSEFLQLQAKAHPDLHQPSQKTKADANSAHINEAYRTLQSPLLRAQYLLSLRGMQVADEAAKIDDPEFLMEVMEVRERIEDVEAVEGLEEMVEENRERLRECEEKLGEAFEKGDWQGAGEQAVRLRYWINVRDTLHEWEEKSGKT